MTVRAAKVSRRKRRQPGEERAPLLVQQLRESALLLREVSEDLRAKANALMDSGRISWEASNRLLSLEQAATRRRARRRR